jgi:hypothetical protein
LLNFLKIHVDVKDINSPLLWWEKHHSRFPLVRLLAMQIFGIIGSPIEMKCIFSIVGVLTRL